MSTNKKSGVYQLENGCWVFRFTLTLNGKRKDVKKTKDEFGNVIKTEKAAIRARECAIRHEYEARTTKPKPKRLTFAEVYDEYCKNGRFDKAYGTILKQDSLWKNHISVRYGKRFVDEITVSEVNDYLAFLYYEESRAYIPLFQIPHLRKVNGYQANNFHFIPNKNGSRVKTYSREMLILLT